MALIHALINNKHVISSGKWAHHNTLFIPQLTIFNVIVKETGSVLSKIIDDFSKTQDPNERGLAIASNTRLSEIHKFW